jgi:hypothetical protein
VADIFFSYTRADQARVKPLIQALKTRGWTVWWDSNVHTGDRWNDIIEAELIGARCVIVAWSELSVKSKWVKREARAADKADKLLPVLLDLVKLPLDLEDIQAADFTAWSGSSGAIEFSKLCSDVQAKLEHLEADRFQEQTAKPVEPGSLPRKVTAEHFPTTGEAKPIDAFSFPAGGAAIGVLLAWQAATFFGAGQSLSAISMLVGGVGGLIITYLGLDIFYVLGASEPDSAKRPEYEELQKSLAQDSNVGELYNRLLGTSLDAVDRFFCDDHLKSPGLSQLPWPRLNNPAPLWTAPAFDRCLVLALIYPLVTIFLFWAAFGEKGEAEAALGLTDNLPIWARCLIVALIVAAAFITKKFMRKSIRAYRIWIVGMGIFCAALIGGLNHFANGVGVGAVAGGVAVTVALAVAWAGFGPFAGASVVTIAVAYGIGGALSGAYFALPVAAIGALVAIPIARRIAEKSAAGPDPLPRWRRGQAVFLAVFFVAMTVVCLLMARGLSNFDHWPEIGGPILLFLGLLTLLNAPFDWISLGMTRLLLRYGLERQGSWPVWLALLDVGLAAAIIVFLVVTMVVGVQAFNYMTEWGGGPVILRLDNLFNDIAAHPAAPKYWWVYALLFSTMIPSLFNLAIGGASLARGIPIARSWLYNRMPVSDEIAFGQRLMMTAALTGITVLGGALGAGVLLLLILGAYFALYFAVTHGLGYSLLDLARLIAGLAGH